MIVTSDNPRSEDPEAIIAAILARAPAPGVEVEVDRRAAIERAIGARRADGDIVVIAGKGHEQGQEFEDGRKMPFDDVARRPARRCVRDWSPEPRRRRRRARAWSRRAPARRRPGARSSIDSRDVGAGDLFVGLPGEQRRRRRASPPQALAAGAWGVLVGPEHADAARCAPPGVAARRRRPARRARPLATAWRRDARRAGRRRSPARPARRRRRTSSPRCSRPQRRVVATAQNLNTEIGLPLTILGAPRRHRGARARDGDARRRPDRRARARSPSPTSA